jgi:outer membrane lipoprotein-sorting protein
VDENSGYTRRIVWLDTLEYRTNKINFYDRKNSLLKTLTFSDYKQYLAKHWRADKQEMINHQNGKSTELKWSNYDFKTGLSDSDFNRNSLKRAR